MENAQKQNMYGIEFCEFNTDARQKDVEIL